jgi:hypothetical protein
MPSLSQLITLASALAASAVVAAPVLKARSEPAFEIKAGSKFLSAAPNQNGGIYTISQNTEPASNDWTFGNTISWAGDPAVPVLQNLAVPGYSAFLQSSTNEVVLITVAQAQAQAPGSYTPIEASINNGVVTLEPFETHASFYPYLCPGGQTFLFLATTTPHSGCTQTSLTSPN